MNRALSKREHQVATRIAAGRSSKEIAYELGITESTVRVLLARANRKLGARSRKELVEKVGNGTSAGADSEADTLPLARFESRHDGTPAIVDTT